MKTEKLKTLALILCIIVIAFLIPYALGKLNDYKELQTLQNATVSELITYKDKDGYNRGRIEALETESTKTFLAFQTQDSIIKQLQKTVEENRKYLKKQGSVTNVSTSTQVDTSSPTEVVYIPSDSLPTYKSKFNLDGWVYGSSVANKDSTYLNLKIKNDFSLVIGLEPQGFLGLGKPKAFSDVKLSNPYSEVQSLRTYQVTLPRPKRWNIGPSAGVQYYDSSVKPYFGIGVTYGLIQF